MPRLLPKLIKNVKATQPGRRPQKAVLTRVHSQRPKPVVPKAPPYPSFSPHGRQRSLLMDDVNPVMHSDAFMQHKLEAPVVPSAAGRGKHKNSRRVIRDMTALECRWWSNPYLRMLASSRRQCMVTDKQLPADFMIRLAAFDVSGSRLSRPITALLPDGVEHPRFRRRNSSQGYYLICYNLVIDELKSRASYRRIPSQHKLQVHDLLAAQIGYQLRLRVLQELELLAESLRCVPQGSRENTVLRRLTRAEWAQFKETGEIFQAGAVAVMVVPPLNRRNESNRAGDKPAVAFARSLPPLSVLCGMQATGTTYTQSRPQIPLYHGLALFPSPPTRLKLYNALQTVLLAERRARWRQRAPLVDGLLVNDENARAKASHAYLLCSDENTVGRADSVPLAIALWRIRMWEGQGWENDLGFYGGWVEN